MKEDKRAAAKELFLTGNFTQERISQMLNVNNATVSNWKTKDAWDVERSELSRLSDSTETHIRGLIDFNLFVLKAKAERRRAALTDGKTQAADLELISAKETDGLSKLFAQIKKKELVFADKVSVVTEFLEFIGAKDKTLAQSLTTFSDDYIQDLVKKYR